MLRAAAIVLLLLAPAVAAGPALPLVPPAQGDPDVPAATAPVAVVTAFHDEVFSFWEGARTVTVAVPEDWD
ncbi:MAG TPA: hypothetical protein VHH36_07465, partial [Candidatus Thermoplasmatota archaeon]|nr:hypothetical protein [Candidatus Thermoplasmatota archaeon]